MLFPILALISIPNLFQRVVMLDIKASESKKIIENKKYLGVFNVRVYWQFNYY